MWQQGEMYPQVTHLRWGKNCPGGEDELNCRSKCTGFFCDGGQCRSPDEKCNGWSACLDLSDEQNCKTCRDFTDSKPCKQCKSGDSLSCVQCKKLTEKWECTADQLANGNTSCFFACDNGQCFNKREFHHVCDGRKHCSHGSDESRCGAPGQCTVPTPEHGEPLTKCANGAQCILKAMECNSHADCDDHSDEREKCANRCHDPWSYRNFERCADGECILAEYKCDGTTHCLDGSDEVDCAPEPCLEHEDVLM